MEIKKFQNMGQNFEIANENKKEPQKEEKIKVLEVDQWTSTGNIKDYSFKDFEMNKIKGGDSEAAKKIFGGHAVIKEVLKTQNPFIGNVWFIEDPKTLKFVFYKANYDSSD